LPKARRRTTNKFCAFFRKTRYGFTTAWVYVIAPFGAQLLARE
jgi:hypothetical protein